MSFMKSDNVDATAKPVKPPPSPDRVPMYDDTLERDVRFHDSPESFGAKREPSPFKQRPRTTNMAYGTRKKFGRSPNRKARAEGYYEASKVNSELKERQNILQEELKKMYVKMARIEELSKREKHYSDGTYQGLQVEVERNLDEIRTDNAMLKDKIHKLKVVEKDLHQKEQNKMKRPGSSKRPLTANRAVPSHKAYSANDNMIRTLRSQLADNEKTINKLHNEASKRGMAKTGHVTHDEIGRQIYEKDREIRDITNQFEDLEGQFISQENIFKESKAYLETMVKEIREAKIRNESMRNENMKLDIQGGAAKDLEQQVHMLRAERDQVEQSIKTLTSEPFIKNRNGESAAQRLAELEKKRNDRARELRSRKEEESQIQSKLQEARDHYKQIEGQRNMIKEEYNKLKRDHPESDKINDFSVYETLFKMDPDRYAQAINDLNNDDDQLIWAKMDFLDRADVAIDPDDLTSLRAECMRLRHENKDIAGDIEKQQNLLRLQKDIDTDNVHFYEAERDRLQLILKSTQAKAEELAHRVDDKQRTVYDVEKKMKVSPMKQTGQLSPTRSLMDKMETQSEFSVMTNESEIQNNENVLDLVVENGEYYFESFNQVLDDREMVLHQKTLLTFVSIDFFDHDTETSSISESFKPLYQSQFSFKNKIDEFYVQHVTRNPLKLDVYISKNNAAIHLGHAEVLLRELIELESHSMVGQDNRQPQLSKIVRVFASRGNRDTVVGQLKIKMRMRRPISQALQFYRTQTEIRSLGTLGGGDQDRLGRKKLISIQVLQAKDIKSIYSSVTQVVPFFNYQFYTFDEVFSQNGVGVTPKFDETKTYEVTFDTKLINYFEKEFLNVFVLDDNAPISGADRAASKIAGEDPPDVIGQAKIPLKDLVHGATVHDWFAIRNSRRENVGALEAKLSIMDIDSSYRPVEGGNQASLAFNKQWEDDLIYRIAKKLAKFPADSVELLFGIFSRGERTVSKEDFKYCVLQRLQLKNEVADKELDMFLRSNQYMINKDFMDKSDFVQIFSSAITRARFDKQNQDTLQMSTIKKYEDFQRSMGTGDFDRQSPLKMGSVAPDEYQIMQILAKVRKQGSMSDLENRVKVDSNMTSDTIDPTRFMLHLQMVGGLNEADARQVRTSLEFNKVVNVPKFLRLLHGSLELQAQQSVVVKKFNNLLKTDGESVAKKFMTLDINKDGALGIEGVKAGLLYKEFRMTAEDATEIFELLNKGNLFYYKEYFIGVNPALKAIMQHISELSLEHHTNMTEREEEKNSMTRGTIDEIKLKSAKQKIIGYIKHQGITLSIMFNVMDADSSKEIDCNEFKRRLGGLKIDLEDEEAASLFKSIDKDGSGEISFLEFCKEFETTNTELMIAKIKRIIEKTNIDPKNIFESQCRSDPRKNQMRFPEFKDFVKLYIDRAAEFEVDALYRHFDNERRGYVTKDDFVAAFGRQVKEEVFRVGIEDIIKPMQTKIQKHGSSAAIVFDAIDVNKNGRVSAEEIAREFKRTFKIEMVEEELKVIRQYFMDKYKNSEISKPNFVDLMNIKDLERKVDDAEAKKSIQTLKNKLQTQNKNPRTFLTQYDSEGIGAVTLRNFKFALHSVHALNQFEINNVAKYLDKRNCGFIDIADFEDAMKTAISMSGSFRRPTEKWK